MAMSRNARRKLAGERRKAKALRLLKREEALRLERVREIVRKNSIAPKERNWYRGTTSRIWDGNAQSVSPRKHCEAKQKVTCYGKEVNCIPKR